MVKTTIIYDLRIARLNDGEDDFWFAEDMHGNVAIGYTFEEINKNIDIVFRINLEYEVEHNIYPEERMMI
jgi:predicted RNase H-like HicB family nuclease